MVSDPQIMGRADIELILIEVLWAACPLITEDTVIGNDMTWSSLGLESLDYVDVKLRVNLALPSLETVSPQWSIGDVRSVGEGVSYIYALYLSQIGRVGFLQIIKNSLKQIDRLSKSEIDALIDSDQRVDHWVGEYDSSDVVELAVIVQRHLKFTELSTVLSTEWGAKDIADMIDELQAKIAAQVDHLRANVRSLP